MLSISPHRNSSQCRGWGEGKVIRVHREIRGHCTDEVRKGRTARSLGFYRLSNFKCQPEKPGCRAVAQCSAWVHWLEQDAQSRQTGAGLPGSSSRRGQVTLPPTETLPTSQGRKLRHRERTDSRAPSLSLLWGLGFPVAH